MLLTSLKPYNSLNAKECDDNKEFVFIIVFPFKWINSSLFLRCMIMSPIDSSLERPKAIDNTSIRF